MDRDELERDRARYQSIIEDLESGKIVLERGQEEYIASLRQRIADSDEQLAAED